MALERLIKFAATSPNNARKFMRHMERCGVDCQSIGDANAFYYVMKDHGKVYLKFGNDRKIFTDYDAATVHQKKDAEDILRNAGLRFGTTTPAYIRTTTRASDFEAHTTALAVLIAEFQKRQGTNMEASAKLKRKHYQFSRIKSIVRILTYSVLKRANKKLPEGAINIAALTWDLLYYLVNGGIITREEYEKVESSATTRSEASQEYMVSGGEGARRVVEALLSGALSDNAILNAPTNPNELKEFILKIESIVFITTSGGKVAASDLTDQQIFNYIAEAEAEVAKLGEIKAKPKKLEAKIASIEATIAELVTYVDGRGTKN